MYYRRKSLEEIPQEDTTIWSCQKEDCNGWIRDNFAFENEPECHICHSPMIRSTKMLPLITNSNKDMKSLRKGTQISKID
ncbi:hypothetical protein BVG16_02425 [Paenibacillus selenitireducens]|uniref:Cold-shock protein n=1 Tax=Paenibacillus selenitireducens TaxID=1324314 RepID=A0A1T2XN10_9BACL|nr:cold-shock protein [Paenibacillus selenitireducens]OPA81202.1 hypothetical protein BVG16_02425 [Paenibacillus selenitireducens]